MDLALELQKIYDSEINVEIGWLWDGGVDVRLGDEMNGYLAEENVRSVSDVIPGFRKRLPISTPNQHTQLLWMRRLEHAPYSESSVHRGSAQGLSVRIAAHLMLRPV